MCVVLLLGRCSTIQVVDKTVSPPSRLLRPPGKCVSRRRHIYRVGAISPTIAGGTRLMSRAGRVGFCRAGACAGCPFLGHQTCIGTCTRALSWVLRYPISSTPFADTVWSLWHPLRPFINLYLSLSGGGRLAGSMLGGLLSNPAE